MSENSKIEWTDHTFNPWEGCQKVGPGCDHCYAETRNARFAGGTAVNWGPGAPRRRTSAGNWHKPTLWNANAEAFQAAHGRRQRVFCASLADVFDNAVDPAWRTDLFDLIAATPNLDWLLLSKRIGNAFDMIAAATKAQRAADPGLDVMFNVWLGATITSQPEADRDIPKLLAVPARVRFLSMEPLLGRVDLRSIDVSGDEEVLPLGAAWLGREEQGPRVDWVIVGGESGPGARPMQPDWARDLCDQCAAAGVPFLFKQWGEWTPGENVDQQRGTVPTAKWFNQKWSFSTEDLSTCDNHIENEPELYRIGKKAAGRTLDGITHDGFPA